MPENQKNHFQNKVTLAITGASGAQYGFHLLRALVASGVQVMFLISDAARIVTKTETDIKLPESPEQLRAFLEDYAQAQPDQIKLFGDKQWTSPVSIRQWCSGADGCLSMQFRLFIGYRHWSQ